MCEIYVDMKGEVSTRSKYKSCIKFVGRCEELLTTGQLDIEGNYVSNKFGVSGAGAPKKAIVLKNKLFQYFIDIRSSLKARLPKNIFLAKARSLYTKYCKLQREQGQEPPKRTFSSRWLKDWCKEYQISMKKPNKRFSIKADVRKKRIMIFIKNIWTVRHMFIKLLCS